MTLYGLNILAFSTLYRFKIEVSDVDRGVYETLDFRAALHPSETPVYLITRVLAFVLNTQENLEFSAGGLSDPDAPCMKIDNPQGGIKLWIDIGNPSARRLHKASKASQVVRVYTYKDAKLILQDIASEKVHEAEKIEIFSFDLRFLEMIVVALEKDNVWNLFCSESQLVLSLAKGQVLESEIKKHKIYA